MIETMIKDSKIKIYVLAFQSDINEYSINDYMYWKDKFGSRTTDAKVGDKWFDLEKLAPDYVFFKDHIIFICHQSFIQKKLLNILRHDIYFVKQSKIASFFFNPLKNPAS